MAIIRFEPLGELNTIQNEMNRLFNTFFDQSAPTSQGSSGGERRWIPAMDLVETLDHYALRVDLPGVREDDVTVQLEGDVLTIAGQRVPESDKGDSYYRRERAFGAFSRSLTLPEGVDPDQVQARFDLGVLQITIPKPEQKKPRQVQIHLSPSADGSQLIEGNETSTAQSADRDQEVALV
jgi:HSP20 family protein